MQRHWGQTPVLLGDKYRDKDCPIYSSHPAPDPSCLFPSSPHLSLWSESHGGPGPGRQLGHSRCKPTQSAGPSPCVLTPPQHSALSRVCAHKGGEETASASCTLQDMPAALMWPAPSRVSCPLGSPREGDMRSHLGLWFPLDLARLWYCSLLMAPRGN